MRILIALGIAAGLGSGAVAGDGSVGWGTLRCAESIEQLYAEPTSVEWAKGYMSGINTVRLADDGEYNDLEGLTNTSLAAQLADICDERPEISAQRAVNQVYRSLPPRKIDLKP